MMSVPKNNGPIVDPALCRCCRAIKRCRILTAEYTWMGKKEIYADMVMDCYGILLSHVDGNERDSGVCATCVVRLRDAIAFRHQVLQVEELFLHAKLEHNDEEKDEHKLKKFDLELKTEPKDYSSDHNSPDDRDDNDNDDRDDRDAEPCAVYSDDDAEDNKPLKKEEPKPENPPPVKEDDLKSEDSMEFNGGSSSDSDEPIKKKMKRKAKEAKAKANGAKKKPGKTAKKQKAETANTETDGSETHVRMLEMNVPQQESEAPVIVGGDISEPEVDMIIKIEPCTETSETIAETSETIAETSETIAETSETIAETSETIAETSETIAETSETIAETSEIVTETTHVETTVPKRKLPTRPINEKTEYELLCEELELNEELYFKHYNMSKKSFEELLEMLKPYIDQNYMNRKKLIKARQRLAICLRFLKTGDSFRVISLSHGIGRTTIAKIMQEVPKAIWDVLQPVFMPIPTRETWARYEEAFQDIWKVPNCVGSLGGRHIIAKNKCNPTQSRSKFYSNAVFIAVADPHYNLTLIDIGNYGQQDDRNIFERTSLYKDFLLAKRLPPSKPLPNTDKCVPHVLIGSGGMPLNSYVIREYPKYKSIKDPKLKFFDDRIRVAKTVDTVFDMLLSNWNVFRHPTECSVETSVNLTKAVCCLHNFVRNKHGDVMAVKFDGGKARKGSRKAMKGLEPFRALNPRATASAIVMRDRFMEYFCGDGFGVASGEGVKAEPS